MATLTGGGSFKVPSMVAQDLAMILEFVDPPAAQPSVQFGDKSGANRILTGPAGGNVTVHDEIENSDNIASSESESEVEVEAQVALGSEQEAVVAKKSITVLTQLSEADSDSESSSSSSSSVSSRHKRNTSPRNIEMDLDEDGPPPANAYIPTAHEVPLTALPVPSFPDPSTLPLDPLERIGEIATILHDAVIVRGGGASGALHTSARERRDAALDEGSLLLFSDRSPLGYVWETFGPTALPHYVVRVNGEVRSGTKIEDPPGTHDGSTEPFISASAPESSQPRTDRPDPLKLTISQPIYHIPTLSHFVFPGALARLKGSDASNVYDEEPADYELEFSDDEAEALVHFCLDRASSRAPSAPPFDDDNRMSTFGDEADSLYGASPYDFEDASISTDGSQLSPGAVGQPSSSSLTRFEDQATRDALMLARNSRTRRPSLTAAVNGSPIAGSSRIGTHDGRGRGARGRSRGKGRSRADRGRDRAPRGGGRGRGRGHGGGRNIPHTQPRGTGFSFEEYDPHMPRPPSPTALAIARATGEWADGSPFSYYVPAQPPQFYYNAAPEFAPQVQGPGPVYPGIAPHINPRFAQALGFTGGVPTLPNPPAAYDLSVPLVHPITAVIEGSDLLWSAEQKDN